MVFLALPYLADVASAQYGRPQRLPPTAPSIPPASQVGLHFDPNLLPPPNDQPPVPTVGIGQPPTSPPPEYIVPPSGPPRVAQAALPPPTPDEPDFYWYHPQYWLPAPVWSGSFQLGLNGSTGNSETVSTRAGYKLKRKTEFHLWKTSLDYARTETNAVENQHNALFKADYERLFTDSPWSLYVNHGLEYDEFKPFDLRASVNGGISYAMFDDEITRLKYRFGAGASQEINGADNGVIPEAAFGLDYEHQLTARQSMTATLDYYPNWTDFADYRMVTDVGWQVLLDEASNLSLKVGVVNRYDSTPGASEANDLNYSLLLLWKL